MGACHAVHSCHQAGRARWIGRVATGGPAGGCGARASAEVTGPGASAYWAVPASATSSHRLADGTGFGLFDSGIKAPGSSYAFAFPASGTYVVTDRSDGAQQKVAVPILTVPASNPPARLVAGERPATGRCRL